MRTRRGRPSVATIDERTPSTLRKVESVVAILLTVVVVSLHLMGALSAGGLWRDEAATVGLATLPTVGDVWKYAQHEAPPVLWPLMVRAFSTAVGPMNDPAFRVLGFLIGTGVLATLWLYARELRHSFPLV